MQVKKDVDMVHARGDLLSRRVCRQQVASSRCRLWFLARTARGFVTVGNPTSLMQSPRVMLAA